MRIDINKLRDCGIGVDIDELRGTIHIHSMNGHALETFDAMVDELKSRYGLRHNDASYMVEALQEEAFSRMVLDICR